MSSGNPLRQKMINMMYLVLTALLALNVSADILKAFGLVNKGLGDTNDSYAKKTTLTMESFKKLRDLDPKKAEVFYNNAVKAKELAAKMYDYIDGLKEHIAKEAEGWLPKLDDNGNEVANSVDKKSVKNDQDLEVAVHYFVLEKKGDELRAKLTQFDKDMKALAMTKDGKPAVEFKLAIGNPPKKEGVAKTWPEYYFEGVPAVAAITLLTSFQNDVRNAEAEITNYNYKQVGAEEQHFDNLLAIVSSETPSVNVGDKYKAEIILGAYNSTQNPVMKVNGSPIQVKDGKGSYETQGNSPGEQNLKVSIEVKDPKTNAMKAYTTDAKYQVYKGQATISADKMNMLYTGLDNPISVSVPGFRPDQISASSSGAALRPDPKAGAGHYYINPPVGFRGLIKISVSVKTDGGTKPMGAMEYRVRPVPKPEILLGSKTGGPISRGELNTVSFLAAGLGESFAFEGLNYTVTSYTMVYAPRSGNAKFVNASGNRITPEAKAMFTNAKPGDKIIFTEVGAKGPVGEKKVNGPAFDIR